MGTNELSNVESSNICLTHWEIKQYLEKWQNTDSRNEYLYIFIHTNSEILLPWQQTFHDNIFIKDLEMDEGSYETNCYPILKSLFQLLQSFIRHLAH